VHFPDAVLYVDAFEFESIDEKLPKSVKSGVLCNNGWTDIDRHRRTLTGTDARAKDSDTHNANATHLLQSPNT
jgi:hypothetical protein